MRERQGMRNGMTLINHPTGAGDAGNEKNGMKRQERKHPSGFLDSGIPSFTPTFPTEHQ